MHGFVVVPYDILLNLGRDYTHVTIFSIFSV